MFLTNLLKSLVFKTEQFLFWWNQLEQLSQQIELQLSETNFRHFLQTILLLAMINTENSYYRVIYRVKQYFQDLIIS